MTKKKALDYGDTILIKFKPKVILKIFKTYSDHITEIIKTTEFPKDQIKNLKKINSIAGYFAGITENDKFIGIEFLNQGIDRGVIKFYPTKDIETFTRFPRTTKDEELTEKIKTVIYDTVNNCPDVIEGYIG